jgi:hypothetical protein
VAGARQSVPEPVFRKLRVFAVDPGMTAYFDAAVINAMTVDVPWEKDLKPGPTGEYVRVVDEDEHGELLHDPLDLDSVEVLAQGGLAPSDGNPAFRQQMVYAIAMRTITSFERALGRYAQWPAQRGRGRPRHRRRLDIYPHFRQEANAFYDPARGVCLGYTEVTDDSPLAGTSVFTCLSQDVIAHSVTHALLAGMNIELGSAQPDDDGAALHEAFADLVALLGHFGMSDVLREQIAAVRGDLHERSMLGAVAPQLALALGQPDGLRNALGQRDADGHWVPRRPDPARYRTEQEPHARGDILVGAVFDAFSKIYESRVADLRRLASKGSGILPAGALHPDLVERLAHEASESAGHVLGMCLRALDYLPPVDVTFGDFLRAVLTGDHDLVPTDDRNYRGAFLDAFRASGIVPSSLGTLSVDTLLWRRPTPDQEASVVADFVRALSAKVSYWGLPRDREALWKLGEQWKRDLARALAESVDEHPRLGVVDLREPFEIRSFDLRQRASAAGDVALLWVIKVASAPDPASGARGGCTLIVDAGSGRVRYQIDKPEDGDGAGGRPALLQRTGSAVARPPAERALRVFAFDPSLGVELDTAGINEVTLRVPWERDAAGRPLAPGPTGEYLEVVDHDPASGCFYEPVDLNEPWILAQDGLPPSESNPQFHQQMVYAVTMRVIRHFEQALGRLVLWAPDMRRDAEGGALQERYVGRLRVYPHALREANAYYSPDKKALLFGYFSAPAADGATSGRLTVFTCLSHDIVAHEATHALLDGIHRRFNEPSNPDVLALHEAFADLVALFEHFSLPDALRHQIAATRGDLTSQNRLGELAQQFGQAIGRRAALRSAIGERDPVTGEWHRIEPDPDAYRRVLEPHDRGAILVAAVFDAFLTLYKARVADLLRIASEGTGVLPAGQLHPDLVDRLSDEAAAVAGRVLQMCIRALDYCPPVDVTFGDYLRALVTADFEHDPVDAEHRRVAFAESFRRYGIVPEGVRTLSVDGLLWRPTAAAPDEDEEFVVTIVRRWAVDIGRWSVSRDRQELFEMMAARRGALHKYLRSKMRKPSEVLSGIDPQLPFEVHSIRPAMGNDWSGRARFRWIIELTQRVPEYADAEAERDAPPAFYFRGGCTLVVDAQSGRIQYSIRKPLDDARRERQRRYVLEEGNESLGATYFGGVERDRKEPFAMLHRA